jgi:DNA-binding NarL/FixJ family response regulator
MLMIHLLIADDHAIVRRGLRQIVAEDPELVVSGEASNARELMPLLRERSCDVLLLDLGLPDRSGLEVLAELRERRPSLPVLVLSVHPEEQFGIRILRAGAAGYLAKECAPEELIRAIRKVHRGGKYVSSSLAEKLAFSLGGGERPPHEDLTEREFEVLTLIASGKTVTQVAEALTLSVKTVSTYRARLLEKMGLHNNAELMSYALRHGLVPGTPPLPEPHG